MTAKQLLQEIVKAYPDVVAIASNRDGITHGFYYKIPDMYLNVWDNFLLKDRLFFPDIIKWDSENWKERIVTINDL